MTGALRLVARALAAGLAASACSALVAADLADKPASGGAAGGAGTGGATGEGGVSGTPDASARDASPRDAADDAADGCPGTSTRCGHAGCVDLASDPAHCGACGRACVNPHGSTACFAGACRPVCAAGFATCGEAPTAGCLVDLASSPEHCGACATPCAPGRACAAGACDTGWMPLAAPGFPFAGRVQPAFAWLDDALFVWGGSDGQGDLATGALYDPKADAWVAIAAQGAPSPRCLAAAVFTGTSVLLWGGGPGAAPSGPAMGDGARFVRATGAWSPLAAAGAPAARRDPIAVWTGSSMLIYGGVDAGSPVPGGARYDEAKDAWHPMNPAGAPSPRLDAAWTFGADTIFLIGGSVAGTPTAEGFAYDTNKDKWRAIAASGAPSARTSAFAVFTGAELVVFGGLDALGSPLADGARYDPTIDAWTPLAASGPPMKRAAPRRRTGWVDVTAGGPLFAGGWDGATALTDQWLLASDLSSWSVAPSFASGGAHEWGVGVWTGHELLLWGGLGAGAIVATGERWLP